MQLKISDYINHTKEVIEEKQSLEEAIKLLKEEIVKTNYQIQEEHVIIYFILMLLLFSTNF